MDIWGEMERDDSGGYQGRNDDVQVFVPEETWSEALHILAMRGYDRPTRLRYLRDVERWLSDSTLCTLDGVEVMPMSPLQ